MTRRATSRKERDPLVALIGFRRLFALERARKASSRVFQIGLGVRSEQGSSIVEFAMVAVILFTVVFGVMAIGLALYSYNVVSEAAREGTRFAIVRGASCTGFPSACPAATDGTDTQTYIRSLGFPGINPNNLHAVSVYSATTAGTTCSPSTLCNNPGNQVQVTVTYTFPVVIPFVPAQTLSMSNTAEMVISQ